MDPLRDMMMNHQLLQSNSPSIVTVEEGLDCRDANSRFFSLLNHESRLHLIISKGSSIASCKLDGHEIVLNDQKQLHQAHETWAIGDRPYQKICSLPWNCHVRGPELLLSASNGSSSIMYELNRLNELNCFIKLKTIHLQHKVTYFNLNNAAEKVPIDGHSLLVQCNGNLNRIQVNDTKLLCQCNKKASIIPQSLIGDIPVELFRNSTEDVTNTSNNNKRKVGNDDDIIVCDSIFSLNSNYPLDVLRVRLQYKLRILQVEVKPSNSTSISSSISNTMSNVSSSTSNNHATNNRNSSDFQKQVSYDSGRFASSSSCTSNELQISGSGDIAQSASNSSDNSTNKSEGNRQLVGSHNECSASFYADAPSTSYKETKMTTHQLNNTTSSQKTLTTSSHSAQPSNTILRVRIRISNYGICIMPIMMTNYLCSYRFTW